MIGCVITNNSSLFNGGIACIACNTKIKNCLVSGNLSSDSTGGIDISVASSFAAVVIENCTITENRTLGSSNGDTGGIYIYAIFKDSFHLAKEKMLDNASQSTIEQNTIVCQMK